MEYSVYYGGRSGYITEAHCDTYDESGNLVDRHHIYLPSSCINCVKYLHQDKDQIEVLFVPRNMLTEKS